MPRKASTILRRLAVTLAAVAVAFGAGVLQPSAAHAEATYCGAACNGKDPQTYTARVGVSLVYCATDAITVRTAYNSSHGMTVTLRYSPKCQTVWARVHGGASGGEYLLGIADVGMAFYFTNYYSLSNGGRNWSNMWNDHHVTLRACVINARNGITLACTTGY